MCEKLDRCLNRLRRNEILNMLPTGQFKFGGNKFIPENIAQQLLAYCFPGQINNRGWEIFKYNPDKER